MKVRGRFGCLLPFLALTAAVKYTLETRLNFPPTVCCHAVVAERAARPPALLLKTKQTKLQTRLLQTRSVPGALADDADIKAAGIVVSQTLPDSRPPGVWRSTFQKTRNVSNLLSLVSFYASLSAGFPRHPLCSSG